jgi:chemotaxis family two-component system response regulator Rcp1
MAKRNHYKILLIEDNQAQAQLFEEVLDMDVRKTMLHTVRDGDTALNYLKENLREDRKPDIVFLDLHLPKKRGHEVLKEMKKDPQLRNIPVIILTSSNRQEDINDSYDLKANCYIQKPLNFDEFVKTINSVKKFWLN